MPPDARFSMAEREIIDGHSTVAVEIAFPTKPDLGRKVWIAPQQNYSVVKYELWSKESDSGAAGEIKIQQTNGGMWFPCQEV
ncbi:MAG: hypothetical protein JXQ73_22270 [Phycisphaerae bacterium]|nr:hypothetical protein [Phycisphaerae bacterium]